MVHACIRQPSGVKVSNYNRLFTQPLAGANRRWRWPFRCRGGRHQPRVPELWTFAHNPMRTCVIVGFGISLLVSSGRLAEAQTSNTSQPLSSNATNSGKPQQTQTSSNPESPITGPEVWSVSATNYDIQGTALLTMGNGQTLFIIKALCNFVPDKTHRPVARSLAKYAVDHGYLKKVKQSWWNGTPQQFSGAVGVALMQKSRGDFSAPNSGYRYSFTVAELDAGNKNGEQDGATNGSQPIRSETNRTSSAAGSRR
jgi:hypothetical protein